MKWLRHFIRCFIAGLGRAPKPKQLLPPDCQLEMHACPECYETLASLNESRQLICLACGPVPKAREQPKSENKKSLLIYHPKFELTTKSSRNRPYESAKR